MKLHPSTFEYLKPSDAQLQMMSVLRRASAEYAAALNALLPEGPDKTYILRTHRQNAMWMNVAVTRGPDGSPLPDREDFDGDPRVVQMNIEAAVVRAKMELGLVPPPKYETMTGPRDYPVDPPKDYPGVKTAEARHD